MPNFSSKLSISDTASGVSYDFTDNGTYKQIFQIEKIIDETDNPSTQSLISLTPGAKGGTVLEDIDFLCVYNKGIGTIEIRTKFSDMDDSSNLDITGTTHAHAAFLLRGGEYMVFPNIWACSYSSAAQGAANTTLDKMDNAVVSGALSRNVQRIGADILLAEAVDGTETEIDVDDGDFFIAGDLIQIGTEVMRVDSISSDTLTVERGVFGSTIATHSDDANLLFPYFNAYHDYNTYATPQTDSSGKFKSFNFFGRGRTTGAHGTYGAHGVCRGTVALKFYEPAYIEFGRSNIRASENSGLAANTAYAFDLILNEKVEKGSVTAKGTMTFTTDSSDVTWGTATEGGTGTGVLQKIKNAMDVRFRTVSDALHGLGCEIEIINGDIRFTSHSRLTTSRVGLSVASTGTTVFGVGNFPGVNSNAVLSEGQVIGAGTSQVTYGDTAQLPPDTVRVDGLVVKNSSIFAIDDGFGNLTSSSSYDTGGNSPAGFYGRGVLGDSNISGLRGLGNGFNGKIDYETGAIDIMSGPRNANFVVSGLFATAIGTGGGSVNNGILAYVYARSITQKVNSKVQLVAFGR